MSDPRPEGRAVAGMQPGTMRRAILLGLILAMAVGIVSWLIGANKPRTAIEEYLRQGERAGAAALARDIAQWAPTGADPGPAVQRLTAIGFSCAAPGGSSGDWVCTVRVPDRERRLTTMTAVLRAQNGVLAGVATSITVRNAQ
ncbi:MAG: hypothetical protein H7345_03480 [Rubritepida sp.]|nr:hypothetical protein [Rubritepida sp.]